MERLRQLAKFAAVLLPLVVQTGCAGMHEARHAALQKLGIEPPTPANEFYCVWHNRLSELPDPTKNGATIAGLPGQMFLFTADHRAAIANGDLTIVITDETPRPQGNVRKRDQVWHFGKDKLEQMVSTDERFGRNFVVFIPFPSDPDPANNWRDVSRVRIKARYDQMVEGKKQTLFAQETVVTLDFVKSPVGMGVWRPSSTGGVSGVPDPYAIMNQMKQTGQNQAASSWPAHVQPGMQPAQTVPAGYTQPASPGPIPHSAMQPIWSGQPMSATTPSPASTTSQTNGVVVPAVLP